MQEAVTIVSKRAVQPADTQTGFYLIFEYSNNICEKSQPDFIYQWHSPYVAVWHANLPLSVLSEW